MNNPNEESWEESDSWSNFLATINLSPLVVTDEQQTVLLERALHAFRKSPRSTVDVPIGVRKMHCCGMERVEKTSSQEGTVWHLEKRNNKIVHQECGKEIVV